MLRVLSPDDSFDAFNNEKLFHLAQFYPNDVLALQFITLDNQFETYIIDVCTIEEFATTQRDQIRQLDEKKVELKKDNVYLLIYLLVTLSLILLVAIAIVERAFLAMNIIKIFYVTER